MSDLPQSIRETQEAPIIHHSVERNATLSADVRWLGNLLGQTIVEQHGQAALDLVERVRALAKARRQNDSKPDAQLEFIVPEVRSRFAALLI